MTKKNTERDLLFYWFVVINEEPSDARVSLCGISHPGSIFLEPKKQSLYVRERSFEKIYYVPDWQTYRDALTILGVDTTFYTEADKLAHRERMIVNYKKSFESGSL